MQLARLVLIVSPLVWGSMTFAQSDGVDSAPIESSPTATSSADSSENGYACTMNKLKRTIQVAYENPGAKTPCKVNYTKDTEAPGATQVLFSAAVEAGYCEKKAEEFVEKMTTNGWTCSAL